MDRTAIKKAKIVRVEDRTYEVNSFHELVGPKQHESIGEAKRYVRSTGLPCVASMEGENPGIVAKVKAHLGQVKKAAAKAAEPTAQ